MKVDGSMTKQNWARNLGNIWRSFRACSQKEWLNTLRKSNSRMLLWRCSTRIHTQLKRIHPWLRLCWKRIEGIHSFRWVNIWLNKSLWMPNNKSKSPRVFKSGKTPRSARKSSTKWASPRSLRSSSQAKTPSQQIKSPTPNSNSSRSSTRSWTTKSASWIASLQMKWSH